MPHTTWVAQIFFRTLLGSSPMCAANALINCCQRSWKAGSLKLGAFHNLPWSFDRWYLTSGENL